MRKLYALLTAALFAISMSASIAFEQKIDAPKPAATAKAATATPIAKAEAAKPVETKAAEPIDINTADEKSLMTLKGIGEVTAAKIIKGRPYGGKDDLVKKKIITAKIYADIKEQIIAKQAVKEVAKKVEKKK